SERNGNRWTTFGDRHRNVFLGVDRSMCHAGLPALLESVRCILWTIHLHASCRVKSSLWELTTRAVFWGWLDSTSYDVFEPWGRLDTFACVDPRRPSGHAV